MDAVNEAAHAGWSASLVLVVVSHSCAGRHPQRVVTFADLHA